MPIYEYQCTGCGHQLEAFQKMSEASLTVCPACQANTLQKLVSAGGFQLKGTGWYATDFRNKGKPEVKKNTEESGSSSDTTATSNSSSPSPAGATTTATGKESEKK